MESFVAQVWVLCAVAFLLGSAVTWLVFVLPHRREVPSGQHAPPPVDAGEEPAPPSTTERSEPDGPATDPAIAALGGGFAPPTMPAVGARAIGALDLLGVAPAPRETPSIPSQPGPPDEPPADRG